MKTVLNSLILFIFALGVFLGLLIGGATTAARVESIFYFGYGYQPEEGLKGLQCPLLLTGDEIGVVSVTIANPHQRELNLLLQVDISNVGEFRTYRDRMIIPPGASQTRQWTVSRADVVFNRLIVVKVFQFASFKTPTRGGTCGILYLDIPYSGRQTLAFAIIASLSSMIVALVSWFLVNRRESELNLKIKRALAGILIAVSATMLTGLLGVWILGIIFFAVSLLLVGEVVRSFIASD